MTAFIVKRVLTLVPTLLLVATLVFFLLRLTPGGPFDAEKAAPPEAIAALEAKYKLNDPLLTQYKDFLVRLVQGDLGPCIKYPGRTVNEIIAASLPISMALGTLAMLLALVIGIPIGVLGAVRQNSWVDHAAMAGAMLGISVPRFVLAPLTIFVFALGLYWLPVGRWETWRHMILPVVCAALPTAAYIARLTRAGMLEVIRSDFVRTARAKGLSERAVILRHALKGGLLPVVSFLAPGFSALLVGSLVIEKIFAVPGMGRYFVEAALANEYNVVMGVTLVYAALLMSLNALADIAYAWLDPRVKIA
jgi:oligopeptide transport system permease protein